MLIALILDDNYFVYMSVFHLLAFSLEVLCLFWDTALYTLATCMYMYLVPGLGCVAIAIAYFTTLHLSWSIRKLQQNFICYKKTPVIYMYMKIQLVSTVCNTIIV